jgi:hypothetical protein
MKERTVKAKSRFFAALRMTNGAKAKSRFFAALRMTMLIGGEGPEVEWGLFRAEQAANGFGGRLACQPLTLRVYDV